MSFKTYFCIVAKGDVPIFEGHFSVGQTRAQKDDLNQFIIHAALDFVEQKVWSTTSMFLPGVDNFTQDLVISAFVSAGHIKFMLLHDHRMDKHSIENFFHEVYELYVKVLMNPFYEKNMAIVDKAFEAKVLHAAERYLTR
mmetsp:Transcript_21728/g.30711  ORF Transcript_21728/g.30711 Transcript_21728/m.30711 type:complete len:140 (+) Transcript_21728:49-468(+)